MQRLSQYVNTSVRVASAVLFADSDARTCLLVSVEEFGVWLMSEELTQRIYETRDAEIAERVAGPVFVPFEQIEYIAPGEQSVPAQQIAEFTRRPVATKDRTPPGVKVPKHDDPEPKRKKKS